MVKEQEQLKRGNRVWTRPISKIPDKNWNSENETYDFLSAFSKLVKPKTVLEIGTFEGLSAEAMAKGAETVVTVDVEDFYNRCGLHSIIRVFSRSNPAIKKHAPYEMAFIDANHSYQHVKQDLDFVWQYMAKDSYILGHDALRDTVSKAVNEFSAKHKLHPMVLNSHAGVFILHKTS